MCTIAAVGDRGPRSAMVDLSPLVDEAIGNRGRGTVLLIPLRGPRVELSDASVGGPGRRAASALPTAHNASGARLRASQRLRPGGPRVKSAQE
jgi:hypothetical protein